MTLKTPPAIPEAPERDLGAPIETERLRLRMFRPEDLDNLAGMLADPDVMRYVEDGQPKDREVADKALHSIIAHWGRHGFGRWAVEDKVSGEFVGFGGLRSLFGTPEVVYHLARPHWGKGYATELGRASLQYGFRDHGFDRIVAIVKPGNAASIHVLEKLGLRFEMQTSYYDMEVVQYSIMANQWSADPE